MIMLCYYLEGEDPDKKKKGKKKVKKKLTKKKKKKKPGKILRVPPSLA